MNPLLLHPLRLLPGSRRSGRRAPGISTSSVFRRLGLLLMTMAAACAVPAVGHEVRPALLQISQVDARHYDILWKQPAQGEVAVHLRPRLAGGSLDAEPSISSVSSAYVLKIWRSVPVDGEALDGKQLSVEGLERTITDVLVSVSLIDRRSFETILTPRRTSVQLDLSARSTPALGAYLSLGVGHILTGTDHLLFVLGLVLLIGRSWALLKTITAFTVAHSLTLAATALGWLHVRAPVIEALVALSIVILAVELVRRNQGEAGITARFPWAIAFLFGLLHGCAFAGALAEIGLPAAHVPLALFLFNVGVEVGQILFIAAVLGVHSAVARLWFAARGRLVRRSRSAGLRLASPPGSADRVPPASAGFPPRWLLPAAHYAIGGFASYWFIERLLFAIGLST